MKTAMSARKRKRLFGRHAHNLGDDMQQTLLKIISDILYLVQLERKLPIALRQASRN
jgi:hypothetical protein